MSACVCEPELETETAPSVVRRSRPVSTTRRDLRAITSDGVAQSVMVGMGETWLPAFALALGMNELTSGLMSTVPMMAGACLQLVSPYGVRWCGSLRRWVVLCATLQALSFVPLIIAAFVGSMSVVWLFAAAGVYWGAGLATGAAWNAWVETLVPARIRPKFFACRNRLAQFGVLAGLLGGGFLLQYGRSANIELWAFGAMFVIAGLARCWSSRSLASQSSDKAETFEAASSRLDSKPVQAVDSASALCDADEAENRSSERPRVAQSKLIGYLLAMQAGVFVAGPFFNAWMLKYLNLSYVEFVVLIASSFVAKAVVLPRLGTVAQKYGADRLLWIGALGIVPLPAMWLVSDNFAWLFVIQILGGAAWAAHELAMLLLFFDSIPREKRTRVLSIYNFANASAMCLGTAVGAVTFVYFGEHPETYLLLFGMSSAARLLPLVQLVSLPRRVLTSMPMALRILAIRPTVGSMDRPVFDSPPDPGDRPSREKRPAPESDRD